MERRRGGGSILLLLLVLQISALLARQCPSGYELYKQRCYYFSKTRADWNTAQKVCKSRGGNLATINSADEQKFLIDKSFQIGQDRKIDYFSVGVTDQGSEGKFRNVDNSKYAGTFLKGQPDNKDGNQNCAMLARWAKYQMIDLPCSQWSNYICERSQWYRDPCDIANGWHLVGDKCYKFFDEAATWSEARQGCKADDADLITINSQDEIQLVGENLACHNTKPVWLGYSDTGSTTSLAWVDGSTPGNGLLNWDAGQPDRKFAKGKNCALVVPNNRNKWQLSNCEDSENQYICEKAKGQCPAGWRSKEGLCYKEMYTGYSWSDAIKYCTDRGAVMITLADIKRDSSIIPTGFSSFFKFWIPFSDRAQDGTFKYVNGGVVPIADLPAQQPNKKFECGLISGSTPTKPTLTSCYTQNAFICKGTTGSVKLDITDAPPDGKMCYSGWTRFEDQCYQRVETAKTYSAAQADCQAKQATLVIIKSQKQLDFLAGGEPQSTDSLLSTGSWLGLDDSKSEGNFVWNDNQPITAYSPVNWLAGEPNDHKNNEDCVEILGRYHSTNPATWNDVPCDALKRFICQTAVVPGTQITTAKPTRPWSDECGVGWVAEHSLGRCYFLSDELVSWQDARKACQARGSDLMSVRGTAEQTFMQGILSTDTSGNVAYWIGANDLDTEQGWRWSDNSPFNFLNFAPGEPNSAGEEDCVEMVRDNGRWNDNRCSAKRPYICKRTGVFGTKAPKHTTPIPSVTTDCKTRELISGDHWIPDSSITVSSSKDKDSGPENSRIHWTATDTKITIKTEDKYEYQPASNLHLQGVTSITFTVQACNDAHISLQPAINNVTSDSYEIVLGGWSNTQSVIRVQHQSNPAFKFSKSDVVSCNEAKPFWISWSSNMIQVGTGDTVSGSNTIMKASFSEMKPISGIAVSTGWGSSGTWVINNPHGTRKGAWTPRFTVRSSVPVGTEQYSYSQWIQADFAKPVLVRSITTKGSSSASEYVTEYYIRYSYNDDQDFKIYKDTATGSTKYFPANTDQNTAVTNTLETPFEAQYIRLVPRRFINAPSLRWGLNGCPAPSYCNPEKLVTGESYLIDRYITSSSQGASSKSSDARLVAKPGTTTAPPGWIAATANIASHSLDNEWIQVFFRQEMVVSGIITKGHATQPYWVKSYQIQTRGYTQGFRWVNYQEPYGTVKTFTANTDQNTEVKNDLSNPVIALYLRLYPRSYEKNIGLRLDVLGCHSGCSLTPLLEKISDTRLSASSSLTTDTGPRKIRINTLGSAAAWVPSRASISEFFKVDFGVTERIYAITTQGRADQPQWVKSYRLSYSRDGKTFYIYRYRGYTLTGNVDQNTKNKNYLPAVITAQAIKVYPMTWEVRPAIRIEMYGCSGSFPKSVGCYVEGSGATMFDGPRSYISYNSPAKCAESCFKSGYFYAGLSRSNCECGNDPPIGGKSNRCTYRCSGDRSSYCGGPSTTLVSVYETGLGPDDERCPDGYTTYNEKCFKLNRTPQTWQAARDSCQADGGDLAAISDEGEQAYLQTVVAKLDMGVWIGLNDLGHQMYFTWIDRSPVKFTVWMHSEPNNYLGQNEDCVEALSEKERGAGYLQDSLKASNGLWNDMSCELERYSLCQHKKVKNPNPPTKPPPVAGCPDGWVGYEASCYLMVEQMSTWNTASDLCVKEGGHLLRIRDEFEQSFITSQLFLRNVVKSIYTRTLYWTDLRSKSASSEFVWSNDWDIIPYTHWDRGQPSNMRGSSCVAVNGIKEDSVGRWIAQSCYLGAFGICEKPRRGYRQPGMPTLAPENIPCPDGWIGIGPNCYQVNLKKDPVDRKAYAGAQGHCKAQGANLAYINNATENDMLWRNYLLVPNEDHVFWIGLNERNGKQYNWISGDPYAYSNWAPGEPNDWDGKEPCVMMFSKDGTWNDEKCYLLHNWICSVSRTEASNVKQLKTTPEPQPDTSVTCPDGNDWKAFNGRCYKLNTDIMTWREAENYCMTFHGHLASIQRSIENSFVRAVAKPAITNIKDRTDFSKLGSQIGSQRTEMWIGLNEIDRSKGHRWSDGSQYKFSKWSNNEPNDWNGGEYCVSMYINMGTWNDVHCSARLPFVCEKDPQHTGPVTTTTAPVIPGYCPDGYVDFENDCYKVVHDQYMNQTTAESTCISEGGHLAHVANSREQTFLVSQLMSAKKAKVSLWIGLKHGATRGQLFNNENTYLWSSNKDVSFTDWNAGEPNNFKGEQCTEMLYQPAGRWNDIPCDIAKGYICRKPKDGQIMNAPQVDTNGCPQDYIRWNDACYKYIDSRGAWDYLDGNTCTKDGAKLLSIQDPYEYSFIRTWLWKAGKTGDFYIGLKSEANSNTFTWSNFWPVTITYWAANEPTGTFASEEGCVIMDAGKGEDDGKWKHTTCKNMHPAICKKPLTSVPVKPPASMVCKSAGNENWIASNNGYCYLFNVDPRYNYDEAEAACRTAGAELASVNSDDDTTFISVYMEHMDVQVVKGGTKSVWIGLRKLDAGGYQWSDNSPVYYSNWADKEPSSDDEKCTEIWSDEAKWNDIDCNAKRGFICRIKQGAQPATFPTPLNTEPTTPEITTKRTNPCQLDGWKFYNGSCYLMVSESDKLLRWNQASDYCRAPGRSAHLVSIGSEEENQWIVENILPSRGDTDAWIGFAELQTDDYFMWTDRSLVTYTNWLKEPPKVNPGSMECTAMVIAGSGTGDAGLWSIEYCFTKKAFICEIDASVKIAATVLTPVTDGSLCHFPFMYRGQEYDTCTTYGTAGSGDFQWCAITDHYERDGKFAICDPFACPAGWVRHNRLCYYFSASADKKSWLDSEQACEDMGAELGYIADATAESFITDNINEYFWIGLNDRLIEGAFIWDHRPNMIVRQLFTNWGIKEPRNIFGTEDCVQIVDGPYADGRPGEWVMGNCEQRRRYVCMKDATFTLDRSSTTPSMVSVSQGSSNAAGSSVSSSNGTTTVASIGQTGKQQDPQSADVSSLRTGEIVAIVIACLALILAAVFIFLYIRKVRPTQSLKDLGFDNAIYSRNNDAVHVGLENPNFSAE